MSQIHMEPGHESAYSTPRWVKVLGIIVFILVLVVVVVVVTGLGGEHGPGRHTPSGDTSSIEQEAQPDDSAGHTPPIEHGAQHP